MADALRHLNGGSRRRFLRRCGLGVAALGLGARRLRGQAEGPPLVTVRFTAFAVRPPTDVAVALRPGAAPQKLVFHPNARSVRLEYRGTAPLRFVDPAAVGTVVAEVSVPPEIKEPLLLFIPADPKAKATLRYQVAVLDDSVARHGPGGLVIVNLSGLALAGTVNTESVTLRPGLNPPLAIGASGKVVLRTTFKERSYQSYTGTVALKRGERALLLLFPPFNPGGLEVQPRLLVDQPGRLP
jgi:hypothetical protein